MSGHAILSEIQLLNIFGKDTIEQGDTRTVGFKRLHCKQMFQMKI